MAELKRYMDVLERVLKRSFHRLATSEATITGNGE